MTMERKRLTKPLLPAKHRERNPVSKEQRLARFKGKGAQGRPKGATNKVTRLLKDSILMAAELEGMDGNGKQGLVGYLRSVARKHPKEFSHLIAKLLPMEVQASLMELQMQLNQTPDGHLSGSINIKELEGLTDDELRTSITVLGRVMQGQHHIGGRIMRIDRDAQQAHTPKVIKGPRTIDARAIDVDA